MGFRDLMNSAVDAAKDKATSVYEDKKAEVQQSIELAGQKKELAQSRKDQFHPVKTLGELSIDDANRLFKVKNATGEIKKKSGLLSKTVRATTAVMTVGASEAVIAATKPSDKIFSFDELEGYELLEDDSAVTSGGKAAAVAGGVMMGGLGAIAGAVARTRRQKKRVENLVLRIDTNDMEYPCVMITYINKGAKVDSNAYRKAQSQAQQTMSALNLILKQRERAAQAVQDAPVQQVVLNQAPVPNEMEQLKQLKELLDAGILTEEEFQAKKSQILGL